MEKFFYFGRKTEKSLENSKSAMALIQAKILSSVISRDIPVKAGFRIRVRFGSGFNQVSGTGSVFGIRIRIQEGKNDPQK
jgi:hypothetical protein